MPVYVVAARKEGGGGAGLRCEVLDEGREEGRGLPGERRKGLLIELRAAEADEVGALLVGSRAEDRWAVRQRVVNVRPVHFVEGGAVAAHGNHALVALREGVGHGIGEARPEVMSLLLRAVDFEDGKAAVVDRRSGVLVEDLGDLPRLCDVLPHEPLVQPLPLGAVAEEEEGSLVAVRTDGRSFPDEN